MTTHILIHSHEDTVGVAVVEDIEPGMSLTGWVMDTDRTITPLVNWSQNEAINQGPGRNNLRAVCMGDYLALYVNDTFVGDATDNMYSSGQVGLAASASGRFGAVIEFDNLVVHEAETS